MKKIRKKSNKHLGGLIFNIAVAVLTILAHIGLVLLFVLSYKYYSLELGTFLGIIGVFVCLLIIIDILFFVGFNYKILAVRIVNCVLATLLVIVSTVGSIYIGKLNTTVNQVIENSGTEQYETIGGVFTYYKLNKDGNTYTNLEDLKDVTSIKVGILYDDGIGTGTMATNILNENQINAAIVTYNTTDDLLSALVGNDESDSVDIAVFPTSYRQRLSSDDEVDYSQYLDNMVDFYSFEEKVKTGDNEAANKDLSSEPFNILLIGFAPEDEEMTYGLADTIIVASVNPQTLTVSMTSIARDSFVPISCYGGNRDKINAARGTSRQCLMDTVGDLLDLEINYYMEVNFLAVVEIVDALGGIVINSPVEFVGQTASGTRGEMTVWVPAGEYRADGEQALAFARERHAMPAGDFDRQQHQQEVIAAIVEELLNLKDVNKALDVMEAAGKNMTTNLSLSQLTGVFNYLLKAYNNAGLSTFNLIDIQNMRVTGYSSWTYNYSMNLPLWIYKLYNGSIQEAKDRINDVMNNYEGTDDSAIEQEYLFSFFAEWPWTRGQLYSDYFDEAQEHEELPSYYPYLTKYTYEEAMAWAAENGVTLSVTFILEDDANYVASENGMVVDQYPRQGALTTEYPVGSITVMGSGDPNYVPTYTVENCNDANSCAAFATAKGISVSYESIATTDSSKDGQFADTNYHNGDSIRKDATLVIYTYKLKSAITLPDYAGKTAEAYAAELTQLGLNVSYAAVETGATKDNNNLVVSIASSSGDLKKTYTGDTITISYYKYTETVLTCGEGETVVDGKCACTVTGYHTNESGSCVKDETLTCGEGETVVDGKCVCNATGYHTNESGSCVKDETPTCDEGYHLDANNACVINETSDPE